jgi:drug/metabolite transporter (DMT)-like permease
MIQHPLVHLKLLGMAVLWGISWPAGKVVAAVMPPLLASSLRFSLAVVVLLAWMRLSLGKWPSLSQRQWLILALGGLVGVFGYGAFFMTGLKNVAASRASLVVTVNPVFTTLLAAWLFKELFNRQVAYGMVIAVLGASIVITHGEPWKLLLGDIGRGELLLFGCVACWVAYSLLGKRSMQGIDSLTATTLTSCFGLIFLWVSSLCLEGIPSLQHTDATVFCALIFLALGATVLAYAWYFEGIAKLGAGAAASDISLVPVFGVLSAAVWLKDELDTSILLGGGLAVGGVMVMNWARNQSNQGLKKL